MSERNLIDKYKDIFRRVTLDNIDIIAEGEVPKHNCYILLKDIPAIVEAIKIGEEEAIKLIAKKIHKIN
jgi:hypothetical protein